MKIYFVKKTSNDNNEICKILMLNDLVEYHSTSHNRDLNEFNQTIFDRCVKNTSYFITEFLRYNEHSIDITNNDIRLIHDLLDTII